MATPIMATPLPLTHVDLSDSIGALQIGSIFAIFMFGIVTFQVYLYYTTFGEDIWKYKALVAAVWLLELGFTTGTAYEVYHATITIYGQPWLLTKFPVLGAVTAVGGGITLLVQGFFALRLYKVLPKPFSYIGIACIVLSLFRFVASAYLANIAVHMDGVATYVHGTGWLITTLLTLGAAIDVVIALSMLYYLSQKRGRGLERIANVIDRLIAYTIRTGLLTSVTAVLVLILFRVMPLNFIWLAVYTVLAKFYSNSLLSSLNARADLRDEVTNSSPSMDRPSRSKGPRRDNMTSSHFTYNGVQPISIEMKTTTKTMQDEIDLHDPIDNKMRAEKGFQNPGTAYHRQEGIA